MHSIVIIKKKCIPLNVFFFLNFIREKKNKKNNK